MAMTTGRSTGVDRRDVFAAMRASRHSLARVESAVLATSRVGRMRAGRHPRIDTERNSDLRSGEVRLLK